MENAFWDGDNLNRNVYDSITESIAQEYVVEINSDDWIELRE